MTIPTEVHIVIAEITSRLDPESDLETRLRAAMALAKDHWMATNEDHQFRGAVGAVMLSYGPGTPEFTRIEHEMKVLQQMSMMMQAAQLGMSVGCFDIDEHSPEPIGLMGLWHDVKGGK